MVILDLWGLAQVVKGRGGCREFLGSNSIGDKNLPIKKKKRSFCIYVCFL